jgi:tetratricopeptide (TPR) repeat protein
MPHDSRRSAKAFVSRLRAFNDTKEFFQKLGKTFIDHGLMDHAMAAYEVALQLDPRDGWTHLYLGNWYYSARQYEAALERFEHASSLMPGESCPFWCIADVFEKQRRFNEAQRFHRRAVEVDPKNERAKEFRRKFRERQRRRREA